MSLGGEPGAGRTFLIFTQVGLPGGEFELHKTVINQGVPALTD